MIKTISRYQLLGVSLVAALFVIYPEITWLPFDLKKLAEAEQTGYIVFFGFRYLFFVGLILMLAKANLREFMTSSFKKRITQNLIVSIAAYLIYGLVSFLLYSKVKHYGSLVLFQFLIIAILVSFVGHLIALSEEQRRKEREIEDLKVKNLQSQYDALTNQINPHFFFNSLNGLTALIRKNESEKTLTYVGKLSDVFRYILQSDKKGLVTLAEELDFVDAFRYMMEVRFANKLTYRINIDKAQQGLKLPVLTILPLLDNIVVHNSIDSDHKMIVDIQLNAAVELVVSNPIYPKLSPALTNGTGLANLQARFQLLMNRQIRIEQNEHTFSVYLPLS